MLGVYSPVQMHEGFNECFQMSSLPLEILDFILKKSYVAFIRRKSTSDEVRNDRIIKRLAEVDYCWMNRLTAERFKKDCWIHLQSK